MKMTTYKNIASEGSGPSTLNKIQLHDGVEQNQVNTRIYR